MRRPLTQVKLVPGLTAIFFQNDSDSKMLYLQGNELRKMYNLKTFQSIFRYSRNDAIGSIGGSISSAGSLRQKNLTNVQHMTDQCQGFLNEGACEGRPSSYQYYCTNQIAVLLLNTNYILIYSCENNIGNILKFEVLGPVPQTSN